MRTLIATTREKLIDWLADLPDNTEIGTEDIYLVAMVDQRAQQFLVGELSDESIDLDRATFIGQRRDMMERMFEIHEGEAASGTTEGVIVVTFEDATEAFRFKNRKQTEDFITESADALLNPQVLEPPSA